MVNPGQNYTPNKCAHTTSQGRYSSNPIPCLHYSNVLHFRFSYERNQTNWAGAVLTHIYTLQHIHAVTKRLNRDRHFILLLLLLLNRCKSRLTGKPSGRSITTCNAYPSYAIFITFHNRVSDHLLKVVLSHTSWHCLFAFASLSRAILMTLDVSGMDYLMQCKQGISN